VILSATEILSTESIIIKRSRQGTYINPNLSPELVRERTKRIGFLNWQILQPGLGAFSLRVYNEVLRMAPALNCEIFWQGMVDDLDPVNWFAGMRLDALLVTGQDEGVKVTVNVYRAHDVPGAPTYMPRAGWLSPQRAAEWEAKAATIRDMDEIYEKVSRGYRTPEDIEACVEGFDDDCGFPACEEPGEFCDNDHVVNHADGGPTTARNLRKLCRTHHNLKTSGHFRYIICPVTGNAIFLFADGTYVENRSDGPLTPGNRRWVQTFVQRRDARNERARQEAQERRRRLNEAADAAHQRGDATGGGQEESEGTSPWAGDLPAQPDAEPQPERHADDADGPHEPVGVRQ